MAMMAMTTSNSINVNARCCPSPECWLLNDLMFIIGNSVFGCRSPSLAASRDRMKRHVLKGARLFEPTAAAEGGLSGITTHANNLNHR